ncbi:hypothetical protein [Pseudomonas batumici]|uniref:hypothetical protein n=1 Tax=Pseudomonas batumici TaxID=226910 RepID=UPI00058A3D82|nr:hypothetical protein [Pseudomonas batumici]
MDLSADDMLDDTCTVLFKLSRELLESRGFLYELACRLEGWAGVEVLRVQLEGYSYESQPDLEDLAEALEVVEGRQGEGDDSAIT